MREDVRCFCGAPAEIGIPAEDGVRWTCRAHAPGQCVGCGPESDEDFYPDAHKEGEEQ
jgi:hypothetical protein